MIDEPSVLLPRWNGGVVLLGASKVAVACLDSPCMNWGLKFDDCIRNGLMYSRVV